MGIPASSTFKSRFDFNNGTYVGEKIVITRKGLYETKVMRLPGDKTGLNLTTLEMFYRATYFHIIDIVEHRVFLFCKIVYKPDFWR